jgi:hypothetical protein
LPHSKDSARQSGIAVASAPTDEAMNAAVADLCLAVAPRLPHGWTVFTMSEAIRTSARNYRALLVD